MSLLKGLRILAVEQYGAGPFATGYLSALGAEVIKVEQPQGEGDVARDVGPHFDATQPPSAQSLFFQSLNSGKKSLCLSLRHPRGRELLRRLAGRSHAVISNLRGDVPQRLGLTYEQLKDVNPAIVCGHLTGYGRTGERAHWPGYDYLMQAEAGYFSLTGEPGSPPARMGLSMVDYMSGVVLSLGVVSGILDAQRDGSGCDVDVSLYDVALHNLNYVAAWYLNAGAETSRQPRSAHPSLAPCQLYRTRDGWIYLMCNKEKFWPVLCDKLGRPDWAELPRLRSFADRLQHRDELTAMLDDALGARTTGEWLALFAGSVPAAPVLSVAQALDNPFARSDGRIASVRGAGGESLELVRNPLRTSKDEGTLQPAPVLGEHTRALLLEVGADEAELEALRQEGVLR
jgi:crotonobetainyl-CoA:carnitine CoA-transferase CaiB-like acyl-CoA transferase